ncbi:Oidioi.mRNA.OKI2018_I69.chr1.g1221.t1.cds [Oikopleura dioica]|uniref:Oidioi.mRNA.OKI2018_I69.chr1.g1221.t1.cds n=1 Tax=Oikopleura dioica TaxID=34765 RepID=A0ABN7SRH5_OIKDI|nr:Oidioi.mRNA.OKI2018_I69.chr1.g1221.t1.cds [Oikopleura dioica]
MRDFYIIEDYLKIVKGEIKKIDTVGVLKTINFVVKFASFLFGVMFIYAGFSEMIIFSHEYLDLIFFTTPILWIVSGFLLLISFGIGVLGMARENVVAIFAEGVVLLFAGVVQSVTRNILIKSAPETKEDIADLHKIFRKIMATYEPHSKIHTFDILQNELSCCGVVDHQDWTWERVPAELRQKDTSRIQFTPTRVA